MNSANLPRMMYLNHTITIDDHTIWTEYISLTHHIKAHFKKIRGCLFRITSVIWLMTPKIRAKTAPQLGHIIEKKSKKGGRAKERDAVCFCFSSSILVCSHLRGRRIMLSSRVHSMQTIHPLEFSPKTPVQNM